MTIINSSESIPSFLFFFIELGIIVGSLGVVFLRKIVYSALLLGFVFICIALLYLLLNADFLAAAQVLIYVGAVNVLIVFAIMLLGGAALETSQNWTLGEIIAGFLSIGLFLLLLNIISITSSQYSIVLEAQQKISVESMFDNVQTIGTHLLTDLLIPFELLSVLLLIALIGAIVIASKETAIE